MVAGGEAGVVDLDNDGDARPVELDVEEAGFGGQKGPVGLRLVEEVVDEFVEAFVLARDLLEYERLVHDELGDGADERGDFLVVGHFGLEHDKADYTAAVGEGDGPREGGEVYGFGLERGGLGKCGAVCIRQAKVLIDQCTDLSADFVGDLLT